MTTQDVSQGLQKLAAMVEAISPYSGTESILVVDDEVMILNNAVDFLQDLGYDVKGAENAAQAVDLMVSGFKPHMLCSDIVLNEGINGVELARQIHNIMPQVKILLVSGYVNGMLDGSTNQDGFKILSKPYLLNDLARTVRKTLDGN